MNKERLIIFGAGGHGKTVVEIALVNNFMAEEIIVSVDSQFMSDSSTCFGCRLVSFQELNCLDFSCQVHVAIGHNFQRESLAARFVHANNSCIYGQKLIHPSAVISSSAVIGKGVFIGANVYIGPDVCIGDGAIVNTGSVVEHDCILRDFSSVAPRSVLGGGVTLGKRVFVGMSTCIRDKIEIGDDVVVGCGSLVLRDLEPCQIVYGSPVEIINQRKATDNYL